MLAWTKFCWILAYGKQRKRIILSGEHIFFLRGRSHLQVVLLPRVGGYGVVHGGGQLLPVLVGRPGGGGDQAAKVELGAGRPAAAGALARVVGRQDALEAGEVPV